MIMDILMVIIIHKMNLMINAIITTYMKKKHNKKTHMISKQSAVVIHLMK